MSELELVPRGRRGLVDVTKISKEELFSINIKVYELYKPQR